MRAPGAAAADHEGHSWAISAGKCVMEGEKATHERMKKGGEDRIVAETVPQLSRFPRHSQTAARPTCWAWRARFPSSRLQRDEKAELFTQDA
jgi:hypothetical protein